MTNRKERESGHINPGRPVSSLSREELAHLSSCQFCRSRSLSRLKNRSFSQLPPE